MTQWEFVTQMELTETNDERWKMKSFIIGGAVGATVGFVTAVLLVRSSGKHHAGPSEIEVGELLKLSVSTIGLVRGIIALGG